jgi:hypothetical protein
MTVTCHSAAQALELKTLADEAGNEMPSRAL